MTFSEQGRKMRWGILGFGAHAAKVMVHAFNEAPSCYLRAIGTDSSTKKDGEQHLRCLEAKFPDVLVYHSYEQLLLDSEVDAIYIGLPNDKHHQWSIAALQAGKHVLCDKPLAMSAAQAKEMRDVATAHRRVLVEGFMYRFHPQHQLLRQLIKDGAIGDVRLFEAHFHYALDDMQNIRLRPENGGGGLLDVGSYTVDAARFILARNPNRLAASMHVGAESRVDESCFIQLYFDGNKTEDNVTAHLSCGCRFGWANFYAVYGTKGHLVLENAFTIPRNKKGRIMLHRPQEKPEEFLVPESNQYVLELEAFVDLVESKGGAAELFGNGIENMTVLDAAREAALHNSMVCIKNWL